MATHHHRHLSLLSHSRDFVIRGNPGGNHHQILLTKQNEAKDDKDLVCTMTSEMTTTSSRKRRKTKDSVDTCLVDLPIGILEHAASFLAPPSRALFAVALTTNENNNSPDEVECGYSSIAGNEWDTLDFGEIEKDLAAKLSDDDISDVLQHIDAVNKLKRLTVANCIKISGVGLKPLRGSTIIEQIDLSLVADGKNPRFVIDPPISCELVLPILDSIIVAERCVVKYLQLPYKWRRDRSTASEFHAFLGRYNRMREYRDNVTCPYCDLDLTENENEWIGTTNIGYYAIHNYTCYQCAQYYYHCDICAAHDHGEPLVEHCQECQRDYCTECMKFKICDLCGDEACEHCSKECNECRKNICSGCMDTNDCYACSYCDAVYCDDCNPSVGIVKFCEECDKLCCNSCRFRIYQEGGSDSCAECIKLLPSEVALVDQSRKLQQEVEQLKNEVTELKIGMEEVEQLKNENRELKLRIKELREP